jgi:hypothetical protein
MTDGTKWTTFDLLKALDIIFDGQHHATFARITEGLGLVLPALPPPPDPAPDGEDEVVGGEADNEVGAGRDAYGRWIDECLDLSNPNATMFLADLFASWTAWTEREKKFTGSVNAFSRELVKRWGAERKDRGEAGIFFTGVKLSDS